MIYEPHFDSRLDAPELTDYQMYDAAYSCADAVINDWLFEFDPAEEYEHVLENGAVVKIRPIDWLTKKELCEIMIANLRENVQYDFWRDRLEDSVKLMKAEAAQ